MSAPYRWGSIGVVGKNTQVVYLMTHSQLLLSASWRDIWVKNYTDVLEPQD